MTWQDVMDDLRHADRVLVNSDFVKETFVHQGWDPTRIDVIYQGLDESVFSTCFSAHRPPSPGTTAASGCFSPAHSSSGKGADHLAEALVGLERCALDNLSLSARSTRGCVRAMQLFSTDPRVDGGRQGRAG